MKVSNALRIVLVAGIIQTSFIHSQDFSNLKLYEAGIEQDSLALVALYNSTNGVTWTNNTNWLTGPISTWFGVAIEDERVKYVELANNNLDGAIPPEIGDLTFLKTLHLDNNRLSDPIPSEIGNLDSLYYLHLDNNGLRGSVPSEIGDLDNLTYLYLQNNLLGDSIPPEIGNLKKLARLSLQDNLFTGSIPSEIGNCTELTALNISDNYLTGDIPSEIGNLSQCQYLYLEGNELSEAIPSEIGNMTNLIYLYLGYNQISDSIPPQMGNLLNVKKFILTSNQLSGSIPVELSNLTNCEKLDLSYNQFSGAVPSEFTNLSQLKQLYISYNQIGDLPDLSSASSLSNLHVTNNRLTFEDVEPNISITNFYYSPQDSVGEKLDTTAFLGSSFTLSMSVGGVYNQYQWYKDELLISGATNTSYTIDPVEKSDEGIYTCNITNTVATDLTLYSRPITVSIQLFGNLEQDSLALAALYDSTDGSNWTNHTNWLTGPVSTWHGITVDNERVKEVNLSQNNLFGTIPPEIGNCTNLKGLYLYNNQLTGSIPPEIGNLTNLYFLSLQENQLTGYIPHEIGDMKQLRIFSFHSNQLSGPIPKEIGDLTELTHLFLHTNRLTGPVPEQIVNAVKLEQIHINKNQLTTLPDLSEMTSLNTLYVQNNQFTFEDIEPNIGIAAFNYSPQDSVGEKADTTITEGEILTLSADVGGTANQYQWYKNGIPIISANDSVFVIESAALSDSGSYTCQVTNTIAPDLTLWSRPASVHVTPGVGVAEMEGTIPEKFALLQNFPNPFNPETTIQFDVKAQCRVVLKVFDLQGREVVILMDAVKQAGHYSVLFDASGLASGIYFYQIRMKDFVGVKKMILME